ncbi:MAG: type I restriction-modification system subunit M, partial [candidate division WOR-3 bacterium]|nr:type I restriction-modification system subunit M [candidate division WOR-3 bacterium]MDW7988463.1 class I SAM-dependent DNA methyltransferase [candidate division WOR-3 bacterium]
MNNSNNLINKNIKNLPNWLKSRYDVLLGEFGDQKFTFLQAVEVLKAQLKENEGNVNVVLSELRKANLVEVFQDPSDARKSIYKLIPVKQALLEPFLNKSVLSRDELNAMLKRAADLIRTRVDYTFILVLLFYKRICDKWKSEFEHEYKSALEDGFTEKEAYEEAKNKVYHDFDIPEEFLWDNLRKEPARLSENFSQAMKALAERNPELKDIFENIDFTQFTNNRENSDILRQLVEVFSARSLSDVASDILGDAYEWILSYFAPQKAKEGEVYTPREVIRLLVEILDPQPGQSVYDPAAGSGGMLIGAYQYLAAHKGIAEADKLFLYGQEVNPKTLTLCKMNLYIHDIKNAQLVQGDTLLYPKFKQNEKLQEFDICIANPPWNQKGYNAEILKKGEYW